MLNTSHTGKTWICILQEHVNTWRKSQGWSRETVVQQIVEAHEMIGGPAVTGINFDPSTTDTFTRCKVNADRVFRWLDDSSKDNNLLPTNFVPSILAAMPMEIRINCINDLLFELVVVARPLNGIGTGFDVIATLRELITENGEAQRAVANLIDNKNQKVLYSARKELAESLDITRQALNAVEHELTSPGEKYD